MSKKVKVQSGVIAPVELQGKIFTDGGAVERTVLMSASHGAPTWPCWLRRRSPRPTCH